MRIISAIRDGAWLSGARARAWCLTLASVSLAFAVGYLATLRGGLDLWGQPAGTDFLSFWTAGGALQSGHPAAMYDPAAHALAEQRQFPGAAIKYYAFFYPPVFALLCLALAYLPYQAALAAWLAGSFAPLFWCIRNMLPARWALLPVLVFPAWLVNAGNGQNGFLSAALFGLFMMCGRQPLIGGVFLGALVFKPQLALAVPAALIASRRWDTLAAFAATAGALAAVSYLVAGPAAWLGFLAATSQARAALEQGLVDPAKMVSAFSAFRLLKAPVAMAYGAQITVGMAALAVLVRVAARRPGLQAEGAVLAAATCLCSPFLLDYDLTMLALPIAYVANRAVVTGWRPWEKMVLLAAYVLPLAARPLAVFTGIEVAPAVIAALLVVAASRAR